MDWTSTANKRVFPEFSEIHIAREPIPFRPELPLICGWDFGQTPAWVPTQLWPTGEWCILPPLVGAPEVAVGIYDFMETVAGHLQTEYCVPYGLPYERLTLTHYGDPAGRSRPPKTKATSDDAIELKSAFEVLDTGMEVVVGYDRRGEPIIEKLPGRGWKVKPGAVSIAERLEAVRTRLKLLINGRPAILVHPEATAIEEGFKGGYHYAQRLDGSYEPDPKKNWYSHPMDALQYPATRLFAARAIEEVEDEDERREKWRSHGASRRRR